MRVYDERDEYGPAIQLFRRCNVNPKSHLLLAHIGFWLAIALIVSGTVWMGVR